MAIKQVVAITDAWNMSVRGPSRTGGGCEYVDVDEATFVQDLLALVQRQGGYNASYYWEVLSDLYVDLEWGEVDRVLRENAAFRNRGVGEPAWYARRSRGHTLPTPRTSQDDWIDQSAPDRRRDPTPEERSVSRELRRVEFFLSCAQDQLRDAAEERRAFLDEIGRLEGCVWDLLLMVDQYEGEIPDLTWDDE